MAEDKSRCETLIDMGICKGNCCGPLPFKKSFLKKHRDKFQRPVKEYRTYWKRRKNGKKPILTDKLVPVTNKNADCVFLTDKYRCAIYDIRPNVCKTYGNTKKKGLQCPFRNLKIRKGPHEENEKGQSKDRQAGQAETPTEETGQAQKEVAP